MTKLSRWILSAVMGATAVMANAETKYKVTIVNLTRGQIFSPPVIATHKNGFMSFEVGQPASMGIARLAEDGEKEALTSEFKATGANARVFTTSEGIMPGASRSIIVYTVASHPMISWASMLATTNDAFAGFANYSLPDRKVSFYVPAYDAGSEANTESCAHVPGPPCGAHNVRVTEGAEGFVHIHAGVQGGGDLDSARLDWQNPVAKVTIEKL